MDRLLVSCLIWSVSSFTPICSCANIIHELKYSFSSLMINLVPLIYRQEAFFFIFPWQGERSQFLWTLIRQALFTAVICLPLLQHEFTFLNTVMQYTPDKALTKPCTMACVLRSVYHYFTFMSAFENKHLEDSTPQSLNKTQVSPLLQESYLLVPILQQKLWWYDQKLLV